MSRKEKILISIPIIIFVSFFGWLGYLSIFHASKPYDVQIERTNDVANTRETKTNDNNDSEKLEIKEKTLEEKEREIESKKPRSKITIEPFKDSSKATVDDTLATLPDAPLYYKIDGVKEYKLKENPEAIKKVTSIKNETFTEVDIKRLQSYGYNWHTGYVNEVPPRAKFGELEQKEAEAVAKDFIPQRLSTFKNAIVGWVTDSNLVYKTPKGNYGVRGVLQLSYLREDNMFDLELYKLYERDVEFRYANTTDGLFLRQVVFLSDWKEVTTWENPYK